MTVLLEYLDLAFTTHSWFSNHNSVVCTSILLYYCKGFLPWLFQLNTNFQLITLSSLSGRHKNYWYFYSQISVAQLLHTFNFESYLHDLYFDYFQTTKRYSYNGWPIHKPIFNSFHEVVYPVSMTTNQSCFTRIFDHKSWTIHRICTKFGTRIHLWTPFLCAIFQRDRIKCLCFIAIFEKCAKRWRENTMKKIKTLAACISEMVGAISFKFGMWTPLR